MGFKVNQNDQVSSLLPYLDVTYRNFYLKFSLIAQDPSILEKTPFPFLAITDSDPLARLIEAQFLTDAGSEVKKVFLLVQRDQYLLKKDDLSPINNQDIDHSWQEAFSFYSGEKESGSFVILSHQIDERGRLRPLQSLFFCKTTGIFFPPLCPKCGLPLQQCYDDGLLISSGLQPYSTSLKRYLFCPSCVSINPDFYVYELESVDPPTLKDRWGLIKGFGLLLESKKQGHPLPCIDCPHHRKCYGPDQLVLSRIVPFSFYPFYLFIFDAMSLNVLDFLSLISGASFEELEAQLKARQELGRISCLKAVQKNGLIKAPFFFERDERYFLEVLYLKLSFLGELIQNIFSGGDVYTHPDLRLSIDRIWVKLTDHGGLLPFFWNFKVRSIDLHRNPIETQSFPKLPASYGLYFLGLVWFYTFLTNKKQSISRVSLSFREGLSQFSSDKNFSFETFLKESCSLTFLPVNIFWNPEGKTINKDWQLLWERSLHLGWSLLKSSFQFDPQWSKETFRQELETLREEVKRRLFRAGPIDEGRAYPSEIGADNEAIHDILLGILRKWRTEGEMEREELRETIILSPGGAKVEKETLPPPVQATEWKEDIPETVILSPSRPTPTPSFPKVAPSREADKMSVIPKTEKQPEDDVLTETVILGPGKVRDKKKNETND